MSINVKERQGEVPVSYLPIKADGEKDKFRISPLAIIEHVDDEPSRELEKTVLDDSIEYRVYSGVEYNEDDLTQKTWEKEYGIECFMDGRVRTFVEYEPVNSTRESAQQTISNRVFTKLENRTLRHLAKNGIQEAAEILRGEKQ